MNALAPIPRPLSQILDEMPEGEKWEIIDGGLYLQAAGAPRHHRLRDGVLEMLRPPYDRGFGGPGGWWIISELRFTAEDPDEYTLEPDVAGWRRERLPTLPEGAPAIPPDWVCEVLSPSTARRDRGIKMRGYERLGVPWYWIADPEIKSIEVYRLTSGAYLRQDALSDQPRALQPFPEVMTDPAVIFA